MAKHLLTSEFVGSQDCNSSFAVTIGIAWSEMKSSEGQQDKDESCEFSWQSGNRKDQLMFPALLPMTQLACLCPATHQSGEMMKGAAVPHVAVFGGSVRSM